MIKSFLRDRLGRRFFMIVFAALAVFGSGTVVYATHSWGSYHWARTSNPFTLKLGDNVSSVWDGYLGQASSDWSASSVLDTAITTGGTNNTKGQYTPKNCVPTAGRVEVCSTKYGRTGWLGLAQIWASGNHIVQGTAKMNDTYFNSAPYNTPAWRRLVMCQEIAHDFGLDHQDENFNNANLGTCMDYTANPAGPPSNEHPNAHDYEQLETIYYGHLDGSTTVGATAQTGPGNSGLAAIDVSEPGEWGKVLRRDGKGRPSHYERDLDNGQKIFTFVFWAN